MEIFFHIFDDDINLIKKITNDNTINARDIDTNDTPLLYACKNNKNDIIKYLIQNKTKFNIDINALNIWKNSSLMWSCKNNNIEIIKLLVENGADINSKNIYGYNALIWICQSYSIDNEYNNLDIIEYLMKHGADVDYTLNFINQNKLTITIKKQIFDLLNSIPSNTKSASKNNNY